MRRVGMWRVGVRSMGMRRVGVCQTEITDTRVASSTEHAARKALQRIAANYLARWTGNWTPAAIASAGTVIAEHACSGGEREEDDGQQAHCQSVWHPSEMRIFSVFTQS